jgi:hypothetical protein
MTVVGIYRLDPQPLTFLEWDIITVVYAMRGEICRIISARPAHYPIPKKAVSIRLDEDVIDFFKKSGRGYQTRMNAVLRHFMTEQKNRKNG